MQSHHLKAVVSENNALTFEKLPFAVGETVEVIVTLTSSQPNGDNPYPLRGTKMQYHNPTNPVAESDWQASE